MLLALLAFALADTPGVALPAVSVPSTVQHERGPRLVHVWATWCGPCVQEFDALAEETDALAPKGLRVLALSVDDDDAPVERFLRRKDTTWRHHRVTDLPLLPRALAQLGGRGFRGQVPYNLLLDRDGRVLAEWSGSAPPGTIADRVAPYLTSEGQTTAPSAAAIAATTTGTVRFTLPGREGDTVFVDHWQAGVLPLEMEIVGGLHDLRIEGPQGTLRFDGVLVDFVEGRAEVVLGD